MIKKTDSKNHRAQFLFPVKIILLISSIILLGYSSCHVRRDVKYGVLPADYKQME